LTAGVGGGGATLLVVGLSCETAPVHVRERASLDPAAARRVLAALRRSDRVREAVALSTCNRTEIYAAAAPGDLERAATLIRETVSRESSISPDELRRLGYVRIEEAATEHLFGVIAGLSSTVLGEPEIVAQVRAAVALARDAGTVCALLDGLFRHGLSAGRRVRGATAITRGATSVAAVAVDMAAELVGAIDGRQRQTLVLGAGRIAAAVAHRLADRGAGEVVIANRSFAGARALAARIHGRAADVAELADELAAADLVVCATGAPAPVISRRMLAAASRSRREALVVLDLAVPRDVDPAARDLPRVVLCDIDEVQDIAAANRDGRRRALPHAWSIVRAEAERFAQWRCSLAGEDLLAEVRRRAEEIRQGELRRLLDGATELSEAERSRLDAITRSLVNRLLHEPSRRIRAAGDTPTGQEQLRALAGLLVAGEAWPPAIMDQAPSAGGRRWQHTRPHQPRASSSSSTGVAA
jgi:glutamyl-tRNA reductase